MVEDLTLVRSNIFVRPLDIDKRMAVATEGLKQITRIIGNGCRVLTLPDIKKLKPWELLIPERKGVRYESICTADSDWVTVTFDCVNTRLSDPEFRTGTMIELGFDGLEFQAGMLFTRTYKEGSVPLVSSNTIHAARQTFQFLRSCQIPSRA